MMRIFREIPMWTVVVIMSLVWVVGVSGQAPANSPAEAMSPSAMSPGPDCMTQIFNMSDCLSYVQPGSKTTKPDKNCCPELAGMLDSNPACLCTMLGKSDQLPVQLDVNRALKLPTACGLDTPPISMCSLIGIPVAAPSPPVTGRPVAAPRGGAAVSAKTPSFGPGMSESPSPSQLGADVSGSKNGGPTLNSYTTLSFLISVLALAALPLN